MAGLVHQLQKDILSSNKSVTELLRTAKVIAVKLDLGDISNWIELELDSYKDVKTLPEYRWVNGADLQFYNPHHGWLHGGFLERKLAIPDGMATVEHLLASNGELIRPLKSKERVRLDGGAIVNTFPQRLIMSPVYFATIAEQVKERILNWTLELEKRGIKGEGMSFDEKEKQAAHTQVFNIQNMTGVAGNVHNSTVTVYDYSSIHQTLKQAGIPQPDRNELEDIMDSLSKAKPAEKPTLIEKAEKWVVRHKDGLGAAAEIIRKAIGSHLPS